jgi:phosphatidate cytidylyltransferase
VTALNHGDDGATAASPATAPGAGNLLKRIASASVLAPIALAGAYLGGLPFYLLCGITAGVILWEWTRLSTGVNDAKILVPGLLALAAAVVLIGRDSPDAATCAVAAGAVVAAVAVAVLGKASPQATPNLWLWASAGTIYAGAALLGPALLRRDARWGLTAMFFLAATVWITDIFAYFCGRAIGGPLLWPRLSPRKTWAGAVGGTAGGVAAGTLVAYASGIDRLVVVGVIALTLSVVAQAGDLFESAIKRRFGAKDASHLIPGHGGMMDRLDGFLVAALAALAIGVLRGGTAAAAQGLLIW